jgi:hypothetical protein
MKDFQGKNYTSARINTQDKFEFTYGRVEMRAKLPNWEGMWPAFWMLGANIDEISWPNCGELDILEHGDYVKDSTSNDPGLISSAVHYGPQDYSRQVTSVPKKSFLIQVKKGLLELKKLLIIHLTNSILMQFNGHLIKFNFLLMKRCTLNFRCNLNTHHLTNHFSYY